MHFTGQQPKPGRGGVGGGSLNAFYWYQIYAIDSADLRHKKCYANMSVSKVV